jgi:hypothetical protein
MKSRLLFLPALLLSLPLAFAQAPSGSVSFTFDRATFPVWDFTGAYQFNQQIVGNGILLPLSLQVFITHSLAGRLSGTGATMATIGQDLVAANYALNGAVSLGGNATRVTFTVTLAGSGLNLIAGQRRAYHVSLAYNLVVDPDTNNPPAWIAPERGAPVRGTVSVSGLGSAAVAPAGTDFAVALPPGVNGAWSVDMNILPLNRLGGTATIVVAGSAAPDRPAYQPASLTLGANLAGAYKPALALSQVQLTGLPGSSPATLQMNFVNGYAYPARMTGKILGQTVNY